MTFPPEPVPNAEPEALQAPVGASYNGEFILQLQPNLSQSEQLELIDWHPLFTGRCPECEMPSSRVIHCIGIVFTVPGRMIRCS